MPRKKMQKMALKFYFKRLGWLFLIKVIVWTIAAYYLVGNLLRKGCSSVYRTFPGFCERAFAIVSILVVLVMAVVGCLIHGLSRLLLRRKYQIA